MKTRMHSSRMRTVRCSSCLPERSAWGSSQGGCLPGGFVCPGGSALGGESKHALRQIPPVNRITGVKRLHSSRMHTKNAFQWDVYRSLVDHIPACTVVGGCTCLGVYLPRGVPAQGDPHVDRILQHALHWREGVSGPRGGCLLWGCLILGGWLLQGGVWSWWCLVRGVSAWGGVSGPGEWGVSVWWGVCSRGCLVLRGICSRGVSASVHAGIPHPSPPPPGPDTPYPVNRILDTCL